jgi:hypothetical protein
MKMMRFDPNTGDIDEAIQILRGKIQLGREQRMRDFAVEFILQTRRRKHHWHRSSGLTENHFETK